MVRKTNAKNNTAKVDVSKTFGAGLSFASREAY